MTCLDLDNVSCLPQLMMVLSSNITHTHT
jgi:hypothetical protein